MEPWSKRVVLALAIAAVAASVAGGITWRLEDPTHRDASVVALPSCPRLGPDGKCESPQVVLHGPARGYGTILAVTSVTGALAFFVALEVLFRRARKREDVPAARVV